MNTKQRTNYLQSLITALHDPVAIVTDSHLLVSWNDAFRKICMTTPAEALPLDRALGLNTTVAFDEGCFESDDHRMLCLRIVHDGDHSFWMVVVENGTSEPVSWLNRVSLRVRSVVSLVCQGKSNKEIAAELGISESTVKKHVSCALRAAGVSDRAALCRGYVAP